VTIVAVYALSNSNIVMQHCRVMNNATCKNALVI